MFSILFLFAQIFLFANCYEIEIVRHDVKPKIGESPHWDAETNSLYWIDLFGTNPGLFRYDFNEKKIYTATIQNETGIPGFIIPVAERKDKFLVGLNRDVKVIKWDGISAIAEALCTQFTMDGDIPSNRIHDSHADPHGNFYGGTTRLTFCNPTSKAPCGHVFKSTDGGPTEVVFDNQNGPNSMAWDTNNNKVFYVDSCKYEIRGYDWDPETTALTNEHVVFNLRQHLKIPDDEVLRKRPDGMTIDRDGNLYLAVVNSSSVLQIDSKTGELLQTIVFPVPNIQSVAFGGPDLDILFACTSNFPLSAMTGLPDPTQKLPEDSGHLFMVKGLGRKGYNGQKLRKSFASCAPEKSFRSKLRGLFH